MWNIIWVTREILVIRYFMKVVTSVATDGAPEPNMLTNMVIQVAFHI